MFGDLTPIEQQRVARNYMPQMGGKSPADVNTLMQQLASNPQLAAAAMAAFNNADGSMSDRAGSGPGSRVDDMMSAMMAQDGTASPTQVAPPARPANVAVASANPKNVMPPPRPAELSGDDRVAKAGGPGAVERNTANVQQANGQGPADQTYASNIMNVLAGLGIGGGLGYAAYDGYKAGRGAPKQLPPEVAAPVDEVAAGVPAKTLPPSAQTSGPLTPEQRFAAAFGDDIPDAEYKEVTPKQVTAQKADTTPKQVDEQKKLTGPDETAGRDNVKKADGKTINAEDATDEAGVSRTVNKGKTTTVKEKLKPKVRVK